MKPDIVRRDGMVGDYISSLFGGRAGHDTVMDTLMITITITVRLNYFPI